ncbi:mediator of RNA polymerase II transcription subunit 4 [Nymphaea colorata]|nr:mediator of RNA polymerase II transcription subunit 4 [Nymphaea colorata]
MMMQNPTQMMAPSPARLGLSNPHSPSILSPPSSTSTNPTPQPPVPPPSAAATRSASTAQQKQTTTLLSLLPPHTRALTLLNQMAALTTKLFHVSAQKSTWQASYRGTPPTFLASQFLSPEAASASTTKQVMALLTSLQTQLFESISELQEILGLEESKRRIAQEIQIADSAILAFTKKVKSAEQVLELMSEDYEDLRKPAKRFKAASDSDKFVFPSVKLSDILSYAHRISYTTFAPPEFGAGQAPLRGALPPAPQEEQLRASQLYQFANLDVGLPPESEAAEKKVEALIEAPPPPPPAPPALSNMLIPPIPSGWQPGMPIELPSDIPIVPPGWKPGDPVPLPPVVEVPLGWKPGDAVVLPKEEVPQMPPKPIGVPGAQEPIQVRFVQLDINPDQDEYSSEYSSDEGSSEDEE